MSRIVRRDMLKVMAATAAGVAVSGTGIEQALAASGPQASNPANPFAGPLVAPQSGIHTPLAAGDVALNIMGQEFKPLASTFTYQGASNVGGIQAVNTVAGAYYRASVNIPHGALVMQVLFDLVVNDANPATVYFNSYNPESGAFGVQSKVTTVVSPTIQTVDMGILPTKIDNINFAYAAYWFPGTVGATHQLMGTRIAWMLNPGLTLFPNPRRIVASNMVSGVTYGPLNALLQTDGVTLSGVPAGATAAFCAVQSFTPGVLTIFPDLIADPNIANYSGTGNLGTGLNMLYMMVPLSAAGKFKIHSYITGGVYLDVWGFVV